MHCHLCIHLSTPDFNPGPADIEKDSGMQGVVKNNEAELYLFDSCIMLRP